MKKLGWITWSYMGVDKTIPLSSLKQKIQESEGKDFKLPSPPSLLNKFKRLGDLKTVSTENGQHYVIDQTPKIKNKKEICYTIWSNEYKVGEIALDIPNRVWTGPNYQTFTAGPIKDHLMKIKTL